MKTGEEECEWDVFISHVQSEAEAIALDVYITLQQSHGLKPWLDVKMDDKSEAGMEDGVRCTERVLVIVTEQYFQRPFCIKELQWARRYQKPVMVCVPVLLKPQISELLRKCPEDLRDAIGGIQWISIDRSDRD
jgi:hypothetical protein